MKYGKLLPIVVLTCATPAYAIQWNTGDNHTTALDVTLTYGAQYRIDDPEDDLLADPNLDDANRNFDQGLASSGFRAIADFEWRYTMDTGSAFGIFARGSAWYDNRIENDHSDSYGITVNGLELWGGSLSKPDEFHPETKDRSGQDAELLDLFFFAEIAPSSDHPMSLRIGRQVINWGESAFIQNGLSAVINPADVSKASLPGTEVKEILRPLGAVSGSVALTANVSLNAYYQYEWEEIISPPYGTFLSPVPDPLSGEGSEKFLLPVGAVAAQMPIAQDPSLIAIPFIPVDRRRDDEASDSGQWGVALTWFVPELADTEFGFYAGNYHRKRLTANFTNYAGETNFDWTPLCLEGAGAAGAAPFDCIPLSLFAGAFDNASYNFEFMEDIEYYGFSWNSVIGLTETAFSGEVIYHKDVPIQTASLLNGLVPVVISGAPVPGNPNVGQPFEGNIFSRQDMIVTQITFNQNITPSWADTASLIVELGHVYIRSLDDLDKQGGPVVHNGLWVGNTAADSSSWGYRLAWSATWYDGIGKMFDALSGTDLIWTVNFNHDVDGVSPVIGTGFTEGARAFTTALEGSWQNTWSVKLGYTNFFGDGYNTLGQKLDDHVMGDRDFVSLAVKYRF